MCIYVYIHTPIQYYSTTGITMHTIYEQDLKHLRGAGRPQSTRARTSIGAKQRTSEGNSLDFRRYIARHMHAYIWFRLIFLRL